MARKISSLIRKVIDPLEIAGVTRSVTPTEKKQIASDVADLIAGEILDHVADLKSPVSGLGKFRALSKKYKAFKKSKGKGGDPNLRFSNKLLNALVSQPMKSGKVETGVTPKQQGKADGHNNFSGKSSLPERRFIPDKKQNYNRVITAGIKEIVEDILGD